MLSFLYILIGRVDSSTGLADELYSADIKVLIIYFFDSSFQFINLGVMSIMDYTLCNEISCILNCMTLADQRKLKTDIFLIKCIPV